MARALLQIVSAGPLTSIQDSGRPGRLRFGVPASGPVDRLAFAAGQAKLGNAPGAAAIELSLGGLVLDCVEGEVAFALTGGDFTAAIDGARLGSWTMARLGRGMQLRVSPGAQGNWSYLAFAGELEASSWLGSRSTHMLAGLGGGSISAGQVLTLERCHSKAEPGPIARPPDSAAPISKARIVVGPQDRFFASGAIERLGDTPFSATSSFDRMGMVLAGPSLMPARLDIPSEPAIRGALQVNGEGRIAMLTADHQTTGGYPKIAVVIDSDSDRVAQLRAGTPLGFVPVSPNEARALASAERRRSARYLASLTGKPSLAASLMGENLIDGVVDTGSD